MHAEHETITMLGFLNNIRSDIAKLTLLRITVNRYMRKIDNRATERITKSLSYFEQRWPFNQEMVATIYGWQTEPYQED